MTTPAASSDTPPRAVAHLPGAVPYGDTMKQFLDQVAAATGYTIDWDTAAELTATNPRALHRWLRLSAALAATDLHRSLLSQAWTDHWETGVANSIGTDLADTAAVVHTISCHWFNTERDWPTLLAGFHHLGEHLGVLRRTDTHHLADPTGHPNQT